MKQASIAGQTEPHGRRAAQQLPSYPTPQADGSITRLCAPHVLFLFFCCSVSSLYDMRTLVETEQPGHRSSRRQGRDP